MLKPSSVGFVAPAVSRTTTVAVVVRGSELQLVLARTSMFTFEIGVAVAVQPPRFTLSPRLNRKTPVSTWSRLIEPLWSTISNVAPMSRTSAQRRGAGGPSGPIGPRGPSGPVAPRGPVRPSGPVAPRGPSRPRAPVGPCGPAGPRSRLRCDALKSLTSSEPLLTFGEVTALLFSCLVPTLLRGIRIAAYEPPASARTEPGSRSRLHRSAAVEREPT